MTERQTKTSTPLSAMPLVDLLHELKGRIAEFLRTVALLSEYARRNGGRLPQEVFEVAPSIVPQWSIELFVLRNRGDGIEMLFMQRPNDDIPWAGEWHFPGTTLYPMDAELHGSNGEAMMQRLSREVGLPINNDRLVYVDVHYTALADRARGPGAHGMYIYWLQDDEEPTNGTFCNLFRLPTPLIGHHLDMIRKLRPKVRVLTMN